jgi:uncharacterized protein (DUF302 family)
MSYYFAKTLDLPFDEAVTKAREALANEGFGVITEIDVQKTMKAKIGADMRPYLILGACNPRLAYEALQLENKVGVMLPCNVIVQDLGGGRTEVAAIDPVASMQAIPNPGLAEKAGSVRDMLKAAVERM